jgi:hypothetical protein
VDKFSYDYWIYNFFPSNSLQLMHKQRGKNGNFLQDLQTFYNLKKQIRKFVLNLALN